MLFVYSAAQHFRNISILPSMRMYFEKVALEYKH